MTPPAIPAKSAKSQEAHVVEDAAPQSCYKLWRMCRPTPKDEYQSRAPVTMEQHPSDILAVEIEQRERHDG